MLFETLSRSTSILRFSPCRRFVALFNNLFLILRVSTLLVCGKLNVKNFGITFNVLQLYEIINDVTKFKKLKKDETIKRQGSLQRFLLTLKKECFFSDQVYEKIYPRGSMPSRLYGNPKMHKVKSAGEIPPLRPIVSSIGAYNYMLAKYLGKELAPHICVEFSCTDTFTFVNEIQTAGINKDSFIVSYDVVSLFTNIPLQETIEIAVETLLKNKPGFKISKENLKKLFTYATSGTHFVFNGEVYEQVDGVAMGSPLAPILANLFLGHHEGKWLDDYPSNRPRYYKRYVDDVIAVFDYEHEAVAFLEYLNTKHKNIKFTMETEKENQLPFLDVLLDKSDKLVTSIYRKETFSGVLTNYFSFTADTYKVGLVKCLIDRAFKINNTWLGFHNDLRKVFVILRRNCYPEHILNKVTNNYLNSKLSKEDKVKQTEEESNISYFKLPYIGDFSNNCKLKLNKICQKYCKKVNVRIAFQSSKLSKMFSTKDKLMLKSNIVYHFQCAGCNSVYVGYTTRHYQTRIHEHLFTDVASHVYKHINDKAECRATCDESCFKIIDSGNSEYELRIKEAMHIQWIQPSINKQKKSFIMTLVV